MTIVGEVAYQVDVKTDLKRSIEKLDETSVRRQCSQWLKECSANVAREAPTLLSRVLSLAGVGRVLEAVSHESTDGTDGSVVIDDAVARRWLAATQRTVGSHVDLYQTLLAPAVAARTHALIVERVARLQLPRLLSVAVECLSSTERNVGANIWRASTHAHAAFELLEQLSARDDVISDEVWRDEYVDDFYHDYSLEMDEEEENETEDNDDEQRFAAVPGSSRTAIKGSRIHSRRAAGATPMMMRVFDRFDTTFASFIIIIIIIVFFSYNLYICYI